MILNLLSIPIEIRIRLRELVNFSKERGTYLRSSIHNAPTPNFWLIGFAIIFCLVLFSIRSWSLFYWLIILGSVLSFLLFKQTQYFFYWKQLGKDSVFFDSHYFIAVQNKIITILPLINLKYTDIVLAGNEKSYLIRFHFDTTTILQPIKNKNSELALKFQNILENYVSTIKQKEDQFNYNDGVNYSFTQKLIFQKNPIFAALFFAIALWLLLPSIIDSNAYNNAKDLNTATSYRIYLSEIKNIKYRDEARNEINKIYDKYITKYKNIIYSSSSGAEALVETLKYLRDKNIYNVSLQFSSQSLLDDFYSEVKDYKVIPITHSFTKDKNDSREKDVFKTIQASFGNIFPADVFNLSNKNDELAPKFEVYYVYKNNIESLYYRVEEENLPDTKRTWYYGIEIEWWFRIFLPKMENAIFEFSLISSPANQFDSESFSPDAVYTNMAISAFNDFKNEFYNQFLKE